MADRNIFPPCNRKQLRDLRKIGRDPNSEQLALCGNLSGIPMDCAHADDVSVASVGVCYSPGRLAILRQSCKTEHKIECIGIPPAKCARKSIRSYLVDFAPGFSFRH
jgi:hypothetical protein